MLNVLSFVNWPFSYLFPYLTKKKKKFSNSVVPVPPVLKFCLKILRTRLKTLQIGYLLWEDIKYHFIFKGAHAFWVFCEASYSLCCIFQELPFGFPWMPHSAGQGLEYLIPTAKVRQSPRLPHPSPSIPPHCWDGGVPSLCPGSQRPLRIAGGEGESRISESGSKPRSIF